MRVSPEAWKLRYDHPYPPLDWPDRDPDHRPDLPSPEPKKRGRPRGPEKFRGHPITRKEYEAMVIEQGGLCGVCGAPSDLHIDHCHVTGEVRGLLCPHCNRMLGQAKDQPGTLRAGAAYLERFSSPRGLCPPIMGG